MTLEHLRHQSQGISLRGAASKANRSVSPMRGGEQADP